MMNPFFFLRGGALIRDLVLLKVVSRPLRSFKKLFWTTTGRSVSRVSGRKERERERSNKFFGFKIPPSGFIVRLLNSNFVDRIRIEC